MRLLSYIRGPRIKSLRFDLNELEDKENRKFKVNITCDLKHQPAEKNKSLCVSFQIDLDGDDSIFSMELLTETIFRINGKHSEKAINEAAYKEAGPIIYAAVSEIIAEITMKSRQHPLYLPPLDFDDFFEIEEAQKKLKKTADNSE